MRDRQRRDRTTLRLPGEVRLTHVSSLSRKRSIKLMSSLLLLVVLQRAGKSTVMDDCESKVGSGLWPSRHLAGKGEEVGRRKLSEAAGMLESMLQEVFPTEKRKSRLHSAMMFSVRERLPRVMHRPVVKLASHRRCCSVIREHLVLARGI